MTDRVLDFSDEPARLFVRNSLLVVSREDKPEVTVPLAEIAVVVASHPQVSCSLAVLAGLAENKGMFIACDARRMPASMTLPLAAHFTQGDIFEAQAQCPLPTKKRLWKRVVRAKLKSQAALLAAFSLPDAGILALLPEVKSGDVTNIEAQAARKYWGTLVAAKLLPETFSRDAEGEWPNPLFNYGYAVLRASTARALCTAGLHPSFGLHHHNKYDAFRLADDLMEPFRPLVDRAALTFLRASPKTNELDRAAKQHLIGALLERLVIEGESRTLFDVLSRVSQRLAAVLTGEKPVAHFKLPELIYAGA